MIEKKAIYKALNIEDGEATPVFLMIVQTIFLGIFYGTFDLTAHTMFLKLFPEDMISKGYVVSGLLGIFMTATFSKVQSKLKFATLSKFTFLFISVCTIMLWVFFQLGGNEWVVFLAFILLGPLNIVANITFWGAAGRIFNLRQGKRLFGIIDSGQIFGVILSSYAIPFILRFINGTYNLFLISGVSVFGAMIISVILAHKYTLDAETPPQAPETTEPVEQTKESQIGFVDIFKAPYLRYMALFVAFSMFTAFFVQFSFLCVTNEKYPDEGSLAGFLGFFTGTMTIVTFLVKTFVYSKVMKSYGLKICLLLSSFLLLIFTTIAIIAGTFGGYTVAAGGGFIYFFMLISLSRMFNQTLKGALEGPAFKLLYQSLNKKIRFDVQAKVDGTVNEFSALFSGIFLSALGALAFIKLIHYSVATFIILATWAYITIRLYREYRNSLDQALDQDETAKTSTKTSDFEELSAAKIDIVRRCAPLSYVSTLLKNIENKTPQDTLNQSNRLQKIDIVGAYITGKLPDSWESWVKTNVNIDNNAVYSAKEIADLILKDNNADLFKAFKYVAKLEGAEQIAILMALLRSHQAVVQQVAISMAGNMQVVDLMGTLAEFVDTNDMCSDAVIALRAMVENITDEKTKEHVGQQLIQLFYKSNVTLLLQQELLELMAIVKTPATVTFIINNISYHKTEIVYQSVALLRKMGYQATDEERQRFFHPITEAAQIISWDYAAIESIKAADVETPLLLALEQEQKRHMNYLLDLLSVAYKAQSVKNIKDNLDLGGEGTSYALELFDMLLSEEIKPVVVSVFDELAVTEKMEILQGHFPVEIISIEKLILNLLDRDPNYISKYTKLIAIQEYKKYWDTVTDNLVAQMFSPIVDLQLAAAATIISLDEQIYRSAMMRLDIKSRKLIELYVAEYGRKNYDVVDALNCFKHQLNMDNILDIEFSNVVEFGYVRDNSVQDFVNKYFVLLVVDNFANNNNCQSVVYVDNLLNKKEIDIEIGKMFVGIRKFSVNAMNINNNNIVNKLITI